MQQLLFVTRKLRGKGGMQQYSRDLWYAISSLYGERAVLVGARTFPGLVLLPFRALFRGVLVALHGGRIHLGDMALAPLAVLIKMYVPRVHISATACGLDVLYDNKYYQWLLSKSLSSIDRIVCISNSTADLLIERGVPSEKIAVIPCGVRNCEVAPTSKDTDSPRLISVGRLIPRKGFVWCIREVIPLLQEKYPRLVYTFVGKGEEEKLIKNTVEELGLQDTVILTGAISEEERNTLITSSDCFVMPNIEVEGDIEGFGIVCVEASSRGVPVVAAKLQGVKDAVIEGKTGVFFPPEDAKQCASAITSILSQPLDPISVAKETQQAFGWEHLAERYHYEVFSL
jgi:glycosyltransferase involved in cell wall biosynthesis